MKGKLLIVVLTLSLIVQGPGVASITRTIHSCTK